MEIKHEIPFFYSFSVPISPYQVYSQEYEASFCVQYTVLVSECCALHESTICSDPVSIVD